MIGDPLGRFAHDIDAAARDFDDLDTTDANEQLAGVFRQEVPVVSGFLQSTVFSDSDGVGVGAVYAGVVARNNPYDERALDRFDPSEAVAAQIDDVLDTHLQPVYF